MPKAVSSQASSLLLLLWYPRMCPLCVSALWCPWQQKVTRTVDRYLHCLLCLLNIIICGRLVCTSPSSTVPLVIAYKKEIKNRGTRSFETATTEHWTKGAVWEKEPKSLDHWLQFVTCKSSEVLEIILTWRISMFSHASMYT